MKRLFTFLLALMLMSIGANAQIPYEFNADEWVVPSDRLLTTAAYKTTANTITVTAGGNDSSYTNDNALGNMSVMGQTGSNTAGYHITSEQTYFVVVGSNLSTTLSDNALWWMNGNLRSSPFDASGTISLDDGQTMVYWDLSSELTGETTTLSGGTCFGLTSSDATDHTSTISYIGFCKQDEATSSFEIPTPEYTHFCLANVNAWTLNPALSENTESNGLNFWVDTAEKDDDSGMTPPALSYYVWDGNKLPDTKITHDALTGLEAGVYEVSMEIRIIDYDEGTVGEGTTFNATSGSNTASQDIKLGVDAHDGSYTEPETETTEASDHEDLYGTYTLYVTVADEGSGTGSLTVSLNISSATYNWISFKNLKVKYLGTDATPVTVSGEMQADYGTLILPFDATITDTNANGITAYTGTLNDAKDELTLTAVEDGKLTAGTPYIIGGTSGDSYEFKGVPTAYNASYTDENNLLTGTLVDMDYTALSNAAGTSSTVYVLQNHTGAEEGGLGFYPVTEASAPTDDNDVSTGVTLSAYHCYLTLDSNTGGVSGVRAFISLPGSDDEATRIVAVESEEEGADAGAIYDLSGRKVSKAVKGVYIQNGKKVLVK